MPPNRLGSVIPRTGGVVELPTGTVTFLISDIEGSTRLAANLGPDWPDVLGDHAALIRKAVTEEGGVEVSTEGDSFFCVFVDPAAALRAAVGVVRSMAAHPWPEEGRVTVRIGLHTGDGVLGGDNYVGLDVHRAARIAAAGHGGQILLSERTSSLVENRLPDGIELRRLGRYRLKDLDDPEQLTQVVIDGLSTDFAPLRTLDVTVRVPTPRSTLVGRSEEIGHVVSLLEDARMVTLTGPGGTGKSRVAIAAAHRLAGMFPDGVFFVPLDSVTDPELVAGTILGVLGVTSHGASDPSQQLEDYLEGRQVLLVLDNFEQVLDAADRVAALLDAAPRLGVLVTSRAPLRIRAEQEIQVPPLQIPYGGDPVEISDVEAVRLFVERARAARPDFDITADNAATVAALVTRLDGLPLAIELAAARVRLFPPATLLERLNSSLGVLAGGSRDLPTRQQTLADTIAWSYDLLEPSSQRLLRRLAIFNGGAHLDQVEEICGPGLEGDVLSALEQVVDQALVKQRDVEGVSRFWMLETIKQFAHDELAESHEFGEIGRRHAIAYLALAERAAPELTRSERTTWLDRLDLDQDNMRAAINWAVQGGEAEISDRLLFALWRFFQIRGHLAEARRLTKAVLAVPATDLIARAKAHEGAGGIAYWATSSPADAEPHYLEALRLSREIGDESEVANALYNAAFPVAYNAESGREGIARSRPMLAEARELYERLGDDAGLARVLWALGAVIWVRGDAADLAETVPYFEQSAELSRTTGDVFQWGWALRMVGRVLVELGRIEEGADYLAQSVEVFAPANDASALTVFISDYAALAIALGDLDAAVRLDGATSTQRDSSGANIVDFRSHARAELDAIAAEMGDRARQLYDEGAALSLDEAIGLMRELTGKASATDA
jgi:predicted ATPase/class 3 adenylate cyclase